MRLTVILLLGACLQVSANGYSQKITLSGKNVPLGKVFQEIKQQSGYLFVYRDEWLKKAKNVDINIHNGTVEQVLDSCFKEQPLTYVIIDKTVVVRLKEETKEDIPPPPVKITGKVMDKATGKPLEGASVQIENSKMGTSTNADGIFVLVINHPGAVLIISFTGYKTIEIPVAGRTELTIALEQATSELDKVVMIAYGQTTQRLNTGSVSKVTSEDIARQPVSNPLEAMEGRVPGLYIQQNTGLPGGSYKVNLRGLNSIAAGNDPLYIVDGVPYTSTTLSDRNISGAITNGTNPLNAINPNDIQSIEVLKDADATAIYGSRGANGVILITTKRGKSGKTAVDINYNTGIGSIARRMNLLNNQQYLAMRHEAFKNDNATPQDWRDFDLLAWDTTRYTDWQKVLLGNTASRTNVQATVQGGNDNTTFFVSGNYHKETTVFPGNSNDQKYSWNFSLQHTSSNKKFHFNISSFFLDDDNNLPNTDLTTSAILLPPVAPKLYDDNGNLNWENSTWTNPLSYLQRKYNAKTQNLISNAVIAYKILPDLNLSTSLGYTTTKMDEISTFPSTSYDPAYAAYIQSFSNFASNSIKSWIMEPQLEYAHYLSRGKLSVLLGSTFQQNLREGQTITARGYSNDALIESMTAASSLSVLDDTYAKYRYNAIFGRINYNWKDKYLINLTGRRDGSSRFGPNRQFANFGAVGIGWIFSNEDYFKRIFRFVSYGKLRGSYGTTGNDQIGDYQFLELWQPTTYAYNGTGGIYPTRIVNPDYAWEINKKAEVSLDLGFAHDAILFSASYYANRSSNQLVGFPLPLITGQPSIQANLPAIVANRGLEFTLNTTPINSKSLKWNIYFNLTIPRNKLISYPNLENSPYANIYEVGKSLYIQKLFHYTGVDPQTGVYQFEDVNKDGMLTYPEDILATKELSQNFYGGFGSNIQYKGLEIDFLIQFTKQTGRNYMNSMGAPGLMGNYPIVVMERWQKPGDQTNIQMFTQSFSSDAITAYNNGQFYGDNVIGDASFVRLKNLSFSYSLPDKLVQKLRIQECRIYALGQNLFTVTKYLGLDPENYNITTLPPLKIISFGCQLTL